MAERMRRAVALLLVLVAASLAARPAAAAATVLNHGRRLAVGPGNLLVLTDPDLDRVVVYDIAGERPRKRVAFGEPGQKPGQLASPHGAALSARGDLFVADTLQPPRPGLRPVGDARGLAGAAAAHLGRLRVGAGRLRRAARGLALPPPEAKQKRVFVVDTRNDRIQVFDRRRARRPGSVLGGHGDADREARRRPSRRRLRPARAASSTWPSPATAASPPSTPTPVRSCSRSARDVLRSPAGIAVDSARRPAA